MTTTSALQAGVSGLQVASRRAHATAVNIANANTEGYRRLDVRQSSVVVAAPPDRSAGVRAETFVQDPAGGGTFGNGVDLATELVSLVEAKIAYEASAKTIAAADRLSRETVDLLA